MLNTIIIEDERPSRESLLHALSRISADVNLMATITSVEEGISYLGQSKDADIIFSDVQLPDGLSFEIFRHCVANSPVIFVTAYDEFMLNAFEHNGIDYLLKPVDEKELDKALKKYNMLQHHFAGKTDIGRLVSPFLQPRKTRIVVKKGIENIALPFEDIVLFFTENKVVYVIDKCGRKYLSDKNLSDLEIELDKNKFFRANRQYIVNINYIRSFKPYEKVKLQIDLAASDINHAIIVSQETAPAFRKWVYEA
ncbi:MAG TPA: LytTR family DNA-binding domain-containing protein [Chitinophagaceae bacterium]|nr:LytTR family DNA-binding domain-containing protein [Chitinophagaceae bacterium]